MKERAIAMHLAGAALFAGAAAWALQQQVGYIAASWICGAGVRQPAWFLTAGSLVLLLAGGWVSWEALKPLLNDGRTEDSDLWRPRRFLIWVALMASLLFLFAILLQAAAVFFLPGCLG
jgi:hypothetical protein